MINLHLILSMCLICLSPALSVLGYPSYANSSDDFSTRFIYDRYNDYDYGSLQCQQSDTGPIIELNDCSIWSIKSGHDTAEQWEAADKVHLLLTPGLTGDSIELENLTRNERIKVIRFWLGDKGWGMGRSSGFPVWRTRTDLPPRTLNQISGLDFENETIELLNIVTSARWVCEPVLDGMSWSSGWKIGSYVDVFESGDPEYPDWLRNWYNVGALNPVIIRLVELKENKQEIQ